MQLLCKQTNLEDHAAELQQQQQHQVLLCFSPYAVLLPTASPTCRGISEVPSNVHRLMVSIEHVQRTPSRFRLLLQALQQEQQLQLLVPTVKNVAHLEQHQQRQQTSPWPY